ncbi:RNA-binding domain-containing protein, partial [Calocera viscosa TUFC12733]
MTSATTAQGPAAPIPLGAGQPGLNRAVPTGTPLSNNNNGPPGTLDVDIDAVIQMATARAAASGSGVRSPNGRDTRTQLYVGNLPYRVRWQDLKDLFRKAGTVLRADVSLGSDNRSRGYGTVLLATAEDAGRAIDMFNGYVWQTRTLEVRPDRLPPPDAEHQAPHTGPSPLHAMPYVPPTTLAPGAGGISHTPWLSVDGAPARPQSTVQFADGLERPGSSRSSLNGLRRGSTASALDGAEAFRVRNRSASPGADVALSVQSNSPFVYPHKDLPNGGAPNGELRVTPPMSGLNGHGPQGTLGRSVFVGNLPFHVQWQDLKDHFRSAGQIARADVATGPDGRSRGFGTVLFVHESDALQAVEMFNGFVNSISTVVSAKNIYSKEYHGRPLKVHFDKYS